MKKIFLIFYELIELPKTNVKERADFILNKLLTSAINAI